MEHAPTPTVYGDMEWQKSPQELIEVFHQALPDDERVERKRYRTITMLGVLDELSASLRQVHIAHGRRTPGMGRGGVRGGVRDVPGRGVARARVVSFVGSI